MQIPLIEKVPSQRGLFGPFWPQGYFYFGNERRLATVTDVKFLDHQRLIVAHRAAARLYLLDTSKAPYKIIHRLRLGVRERFRKRFFHPDLMALDGNSVYLSCYGREYAEVRINNDRFTQAAIQSVGTDQYHACATDDDFILLGGTKSNQITRVHKQSGSVSTLDLDTRDPLRIKTIDRQNGTYLLSLDKKEGSSKKPGSHGNAWFSQYRQDGHRLVEVDSILFEGCQIDGAISHNGLHYVSLHDSHEKCGYIITVETRNGLNILKKTVCERFPHGLDVRDQQLAYSTYSTSSVHIEPLSNFQPTPASSQPVS
ncbi:hypothetical protein MK280_16025 [Myxococcota bacterium]|nr:hypothetical protein [Myxococcota bacterium]